VEQGPVVEGVLQGFRQLRAAKRYFLPGVLPKQVFV